MRVEETKTDEASDRCCSSAAPVPLPGGHSAVALVGTLSTSDWPVVVLAEEEGSSAALAEAKLKEGIVAEEMEESMALMGHTLYTSK